MTQQKEQQLWYETIEQQIISGKQKKNHLNNETEKPNNTCGPETS